MAFAKNRAAGPRVAWWRVQKDMKGAEEGEVAEEKNAAPCSWVIRFCENPIDVLSFYAPIAEPFVAGSRRGALLPSLRS